MPRFYPNSRFSDCWASVGNITFYHRDGICYFRSKAYSEFAGTTEQMEILNLHKRAIRAWQRLDRNVQEVWRDYASVVAAHRPPFGDGNHISGYNLFVSAYHGFAQLGSEHVPEPQAFKPFPIFSLDFGESGRIGDTGILLRFRLTLCGTNDSSRYRVLGKIQLTELGAGRNPGMMRNYLSPSIPEGQSSEVDFVVPTPAENLDTYQIHMRYLLLDSVTGYRSQHHTLSTLAAPEQAK